MPATSDISQVAILTRLIRPERGTWSKQAAKSILQFDFSSADLQRLNILAMKARRGTLSNREEIELENYRVFGRMLELLQSKARLSLKRILAAA